MNRTFPKEDFDRSPIVKRSVKIHGHSTSMSMEDLFWRGLKEIALLRDMRIRDLATEIDDNRKHHNLSSAIRVFVLAHYMKTSGSPVVAAAATVNQVPQSARV